MRLIEIMYKSVSSSLQLLYCSITLEAIIIGIRVYTPHVWYTYIYIFICLSIYLLFVLLLLLLLFVLLLFVFLTRLLFVLTNVLVNEFESMSLDENGKLHVVSVLVRVVVKEVYPDVIPFACRELSQVMYQVFKPGMSMESNHAVRLIIHT